MNLQELRDLIKDATTTDNLELIAKINSKINELETQEKIKDEKLLDISTKYIDLVKNTQFNNDQSYKEKEKQEPQTFEECVESVLNEKEKK